MMETVRASLANALADIFDLFTSRQNRAMAVFWSACLVGVFVLGSSLQKQSAAFLGIAESRETVINFEFPVVVQRVRVVPGQIVTKGDLIVEVEQPELGLKTQSVRSSLAKLKAEQALKNELNRLVLGQNKDRDNNRDRKEDNQRGMDPMSEEIRGLQSELVALESRERGLYVFAEVSGIVGSVNFKRGETAAPYAPVMTISSAAPTFVQGFVHESLQARYLVGQKVNVGSVSESGKTSEGRIVGLGTRIVELPERMLRAQSQKIWGREITVEIPRENAFLLGERVRVEPAIALLSFPMAQADAHRLETSGAPNSFLKKNAVAALVAPHAVAVPEALKGKTAFEPSAAVYLSDVRKYAVLSDDTDDRDTPFVFLLNPDGSLDSQPARIEGLDRLADAESVSIAENGDLYVLSSQSRSRSGKVKRDRNLLAQIKRRGVQFTLVGQVMLRDLLLGALRTGQIKELNVLQADLEAELEIEASYIQDGRLMVGLKKPLDESAKSLVLDLGSAEKIISEKRIDPKVVKVVFRLEFPGTGQSVTRISDIVAVGEQMFVATVSQKPGRTGRVWKFDSITKKLTLLGEFQEHAPEGLAFDPVLRELMVLFDEGDAPALFTKVPLADKI